MSSDKSVNFSAHIKDQIAQVKLEGLFKNERVITTAQQALVGVDTGEKVLNFCSNNYLGLANNPRLISAAKVGLDNHGFGMAWLRFVSFVALKTFIKIWKAS